MEKCMKTGPIGGFARLLKKENCNSSETWSRW